MISSRLFTRLCTVAGWCAVVLIAVLSLVPGPERPHTGAPGQVEHAFAYAMTAAALLVAYPRARLPVVAVLCLYAGILETLQIWVPGRTSQVIDFLASSLGVLVGLAIATWVVPPLARRLVITTA